MEEVYLQPKIIGKRFEDHALPVSLLSDFSALEEFLIELAKQKYLDANPKRERVPRGFSKGISLKLSKIEEGSVIPTFVLASTLSASGLFKDNETSLQYFNDARDTFIQVLEDAEKNDIKLEKRFISYFNRIGKNLHDDESILFNYQSSESKAILNKEIRKKILLSNDNTGFLDNIESIFTVSEFDKDKQTCTLKNSKNKFSGVYVQDELKELIYKAFHEYEKGIHIKIKGVAKLNVLNDIIMIETIEHVDLLEKNDLEVRLEYISSLNSGWYYGEGSSFEKKSLDHFLNKFTDLYNEDLPTPSTYPTVNGEIQLEWSNTNCDISLTININTLSAELHMLSFQEDSDSTQSLDLNNENDWNNLNLILLQKLT